MAREMAAKTPEKLEARSPEQALTLVHELQVHQIELEMQNEELHRAQMELDASQARYFNLYDLAPVGYCTLSEQGLILEANLTAAILLGVDRGNLVKQPLSRFIHPEDRETYYRHHQHLLKVGKQQVCETRMVRTGDAPFWGRVEATMTQSGEGSPVYRVVISDITERKQAEEGLQRAHDELEQRVATRTEELRAEIAERRQAEKALQESKETAKRIAQENYLVAEIGRIIGSTLNIDEVYERFAEKVREIIPFDAITINMVNIRNNTRTIRYHSGMQIKGRKIGDAVPLDGSMTERIVRTRSSLLITEKDVNELLRQYPGSFHTLTAGIQSRMGIPLISKDEVIGTLLLRSVEPDAYSEGDLRLAEKVGSQIAGAIANAQLFLDRRQAEEELKTAKNFLDAVLDNLSDSLIVLDPSTYVIVEANKNYLNFCGLDKDAVIGKRCYELTHHRSTPCSPPDDICPLGETLKTGRLSTVEHIHCDSTGSKLNVEVSTVPIMSEGGEIHQVIHLSRNITERKQALQALLQQREELSQVSRLATLGEFAASIAHEVNQPLAAILNNAQAAQRLLSLDTPAIDEVRNALQDIIDDDRRASEVIRHLRSFLIKRKDPERAIIDMNSVIEEVLTILHHEIVDRHVSVTLDMSPDIPPVEGDRIELQQVLMNLILNGCDAMVNSDFQRRHIRIRTSVDEPNSIIVAVQDSGTGLDTNEINRVFEHFYTTKQEGLGMGLSISKSIIAAHGGRIWAVNKPDGGATFYFTLPTYQGKAP